MSSLRSRLRDWIIDRLATITNRTIRSRGYKTMCTRCRKEAYIYSKRTWVMDDRYGVFTENCGPYGEPHQPLEDYAEQRRLKLR
jgi:hypothetical protein